MILGKTKKGASADRGVAILIAISVLAILTILVWSLAYSAGTAQQAQSAGFTRLRADHLARAGYDYAVAILGRMPGELPEAREMDLALEEGKCHIAAKPTRADDAVYSGKFLRQRPGDVLLTVTASVKSGAFVEKASHVYLVNVNPSHPRRLLYQENPSSVEAQKKP